MYSPKIREDLIPRIHRAAKEAQFPMTVWVNQAVERRLHGIVPQPKPKTERKEISYEHASS